MGNRAIAYFVERWEITLTIFLLLATLGGISLVLIPKSEDPQFPVPIFHVAAFLPGASPLEMEQLVARPIETGLAELDDVHEIQTTAASGSSIIQIEFKWNDSVELQYDRVISKINEVRGGLPANIGDIEVRRIQTSEVAIIQLALTSEIMPIRVLEKRAKTLRDRLSQIPGIRTARYTGAQQSIALVSLNPAKLAELGIASTSVSNALRNAGSDTPIGEVSEGALSFNVRTDGVFKALDDVRNISIATAPNGAIIRVRDVASVSWGRGENYDPTTFNGKRAIFITATQEVSADVRDVTAKAEIVISDYRKTLPSDAQLDVVFKQADNTQSRLSQLYTDFLLALILVLIFLLPLGLRAAVVVMISIPLSLLLGIAFLYNAGLSLNQLSIAGFILALGLLVDDAIVVAENITRHLRNGADRLTAAVEGTTQVFWAVSGSTATLMLAFVPLLALPDAAGAFIKSLPLAVLGTIAASFIVSLTIIPFLASRFLSPHEPEDGNIILRKIMAGVHGVYRPLLRRALKYPKASFFIIFLISSLSVPLYNVIGTSLFPAAETPQFVIRVVTPTNTAVAKTRSILQQAEKRVRQSPEVEWVASSLGQGNPQIFYNVPQYTGSSNFAEMFVGLKEWKPGETSAFYDHLRQELRQIPGAQFNVIEFKNGGGGDPYPIAVRIVGENLDTLYNYAKQVENIIGSVPGTRDIVNPIRRKSIELSLESDPAKAALLGIPAGEINSAAALAIGGERVSVIRDEDGDQYPVTVRLPRQNEFDFTSIGQIYVSSSDQTAIRLDEVATPQLVSGNAQISRYNRERAVTIEARVTDPAQTLAITNNVKQQIESELQLPPNYRLIFDGEIQETEQIFGGLGIAVLVSVLGIMIVLLLQFRKFRLVLIVGGIIPLGFFGAVTGLWISGYSLSFMAGIGIAALIGIEIKNSILLVDFTEQLLDDGMELRDAIEQAGEVRFLPVLLTSITAICGLLPLALSGSGLYSPLTIAIIGGLVTATLLSRIATPVMYLLLSGRAKKAA